MSRSWKDSTAENASDKLTSIVRRKTRLTLLQIDVFLKTVNITRRVKLNRGDPNYKTKRNCPKLRSLNQRTHSQVALVFKTKTTKQSERETDRKRSHRLATSRANSLVAAGWTLVLLNMLSPSWCNLYTLAMEPLLTDVTANPEFI